LYRYLFREDIYYIAYQNLYKNNGAITKGINDDTADGFSKNYVQSIINELRDGSYKASPVRRVNIPKKNGKTRPLGIPTFKDKLIQEVVKMFLNSIYEPIFKDTSHGFRDKRSCHTALKFVKYQFTGSKWFIEGDIKGCFDNIDHEVLLNILRKKIKDSKFINIIGQFLKAGYMEEWKINNTYSGAPQGGICSPILANIYLHELDVKVQEIKEKFDKSNTRKATAEYRELENAQKRLRYRIKKTKNDIERKMMIQEFKRLGKVMRTIPYVPNENKRLIYVRYADDWLIGISGTREEASVIKELIKEYLDEELNLILSDEKTHITHSSKKIRFLGYDISVRRDQQVKGYKRKDGKKIKTRSLNNTVALTIPMKDKIVSFLVSKGAVKRLEGGKLKSKARYDLINLADSEIVAVIGAELRGLCNFYNLACDHHLLVYFCMLMEYSCLCTIAHKHKCSISKITKMYKDGHSWSVPYNTKQGVRKVTIPKISDCKEKLTNDTKVRKTLHNNKSTIRQRLNASICELCGSRESANFEVHVVKKLKELNDSRWEQVMKTKRRKTLIVCEKCHTTIHR
jgi:group II intron reverse transcriptase/maturase